MRLLFDSHFLIALANDDFPSVERRIFDAAASVATEQYASVASVWEMAIKARLGKLALNTPLMKLPAMFEAYDFIILDINRHHVLDLVDPMPNTRDPFDRLLLAQCQVENLRLVTTDRALVNHPLAWRER